jgi:serine/threonine-protein kinase
MPTKIGRYEIKSELGRGGMATVYRAYDPSFEREVAIKVLPRELLHDPQFHDRFRREIKTVAALEHPAIVPVYDVGEEDGVPYFVMRYMTGGSLTQWIEKGKFSVVDAARIIERLAGALSYAHKNGLVHRDLKPDNILFDSNGDPFISDFGVAKLNDSSTNMTGSGIIGTPAYMSPEQAQGDKVDNRSDIYGLGVIIFQMLSGQQPYNATTPMGVAVKHITDPVPEILKVNPALPPEADMVIKTAMAKDKDKRYPSALDLARALNQIAAEKQPATVSQAAVSSAKSNNLVFIIGGVLVLLLVVAGAGFLLRNTLFAPPPPPTATATRQQVATATLPPATSTVQPTIQSVASAAPQFAPVCAPGVVSAIPTPAIAIKNQFCNTKIGATTLSISNGATFESQKAGFVCDMGGQSGDNQLITCHGGAGDNNTSFNIKVCIPLPTPSSSVVVGACQQGTEYDYDHQCCTAPRPQDAGCTLYKVDLPACG